MKLCNPQVCGKPRVKSESVGGCKLARKYKKARNKSKKRHNILKLQTTNK